jgi:hypothetical protein
MTREQINEWLASGKHVVTYTAGFMTAVGIVSVGGLSPGDIQTDLDHVFKGIEELSIGLGPLLAAGMGWWAQHRAKLSTKIADVKAASPGALVKAVQQVSPVTLRDAVAEQPEVERVVVTDPATAAASPSNKVTSNNAR